MATHDDKEGSPPGEERKRPTGRRKPTLGNPDADPQRIHREYLERHLRGGAPATQEAYERAGEQWRRLPGANTDSPAELHGPEESDAGEDESDADSEPGESADAAGADDAGSEDTSSGDVP